MCRVGAGEQIATSSVPDLRRRETQSCCRLCWSKEWIRNEDQRVQWIDRAEQDTNKHHQTPHLRWAVIDFKIWFKCTPVMKWWLLPVLLLVSRKIFILHQWTLSLSYNKYYKVSFVISSSRISLPQNTHLFELFLAPWPLYSLHSVERRQFRLSTSISWMLLEQFLVKRLHQASLQLSRQGIEEICIQLPLRARSIMGRNHSLFMDNFFTNIPLFLELLDEHLYAWGTLRCDRKYLPDDMKTIAKNGLSTHGDFEFH